MPNPHDDHPEVRAEHSAGEQAVEPKQARAIEVRFARSNIAVEWDDGRFDCLLDLARELNVDISSGCRYGDCGTCMTELLQGNVAYNHATGIEPDVGYCLPCSCRPLTSITLDA